MSTDELQAAEDDLAEQLQQHSEALQGVREALQADQGNVELVQAEAELAAATTEIEATLLELKRERLLAQLGGSIAGGDDSALESCDVCAIMENEHALRALPAPAHRGTQPSTIGGHSDIRIGGRYRFRFIDGHWHAGLVVALQHVDNLQELETHGSNSTARSAHRREAVVRFLHPTQRTMLGGVQLPASALQPDHDKPHDVTRLAPGDTAYAQISRSSSSEPDANAQQRFTGSSSGGQLWEEVTILSFQHGGHAACVAATADASRTATIAADDLVLTPFADDPPSSDSEPGSDGGGDSDGDGDMRPRGGGASSRQHDEYQPAPSIPHDGDAELDPMRLAEAQDARAVAERAVAAAAAAGRQLETVTFADWEAHERGVGSKIMAAMGFIAGRGLGKSGAGIAAPIQVTALRPGAGLGLVHSTAAEGATAAKKRRRGGRKARLRKHAEAQRADREARRDGHAAADAAADAPGLFGFINSSLGDRSEAAAVRRSGTAAEQQQPSRFGSQAPAKSATSSRRALAEQHRSTDKLRATISHLEAMAQRQARDAVMAPQIARKLAAARAALAAADGAHGSALASIQEKEKQKRWTKF